VPYYPAILPAYAARWLLHKSRTLLTSGTHNLWAWHNP